MGRLVEKAGEDAMIEDDLEAVDAIGEDGLKEVVEAVVAVALAEGLDVAIAETENADK